MQNVKHLFGDGADHEAALGVSAARMSYQLPTHLLRMGDVYLIAAEAYLLGGNDAKAKEYVNAVRARAGVEALATVTFQDIWKERRLELAGEVTVGMTMFVLLIMTSRLQWMTLSHRR